MSAGRLVMPTRILIVGSGGREHALAWKLSAEPGINEVIVAPGSDAMTTLPRVRRLASVDPLDGPAVVEAARSTSAELVVIGPEAPLAAGVADALVAAGIAVFGASAAAARIESSKAFCHEIAAAAGVPMARSGAFTDAATAIDFARALDADGRGVVVKADGLAAGKGVTVADDLDEAIAAIRVAATAGTVVIEERLEGREASLIAICDGRDALALPIARDHKRLGDGDAGPNTGGMGAVSPLPDLPDAAADHLLERFHRPILAELARRGTPFRGALYAGLMLTADGPVLLECNARFGDPETQAIVPRLAVPLGPLLLAAARGGLADAVRPAGSRWRSRPDPARAPPWRSCSRRPGIRRPRAATIRSRDWIEPPGTGRSSSTRAPRDPRMVPIARPVVACSRSSAGPRRWRTPVRSPKSAADEIAFDGAQRRHDIGRDPVAIVGAAR